MSFAEALKQAVEEVNFNNDLESVLCTSNLQPGVFWVPYRGNDTFKCAKCQNLATKRGLDKDEKLLFLSCQECMFKFCNP